MPTSRNRKKAPRPTPSEVPASQRVKSRYVWAILLAVFGVIIAFFAVGLNYIALIIGGLIGAIGGYFIGKKMVKDLAGKD